MTFGWHFAVDPVIGAGVLRLHGGDRRRLCSVHGGGRRAATHLGGELERRRYLLSAFAVISYTQNPAYVLFAALGSSAGAFASVTWLRRDGP